MNRAFTHDPTTFSYEVMTKPISAGGHIGFCDCGDPSERRLWRPQQISSVCSGLHMCQMSCL